MKSTFSKNITSLLLVAALAISGISYQGKEAKAADTPQTLFTIEDFNNLNDKDPLPAGTAATYTFTIPDNVSSKGIVGIFFNLLSNKTEISVEITDSTGKSVFTEKISTTDEYWDSYTEENTTVYSNLSAWESPTAGTYTLSLTFAEDTYFFAAGILTEAAPNPTQTPTKTPAPTPVNTPTPYLNAPSSGVVTVTAGFSQTISVNNAGGAVTWSSSNNAIATVNNGNITGKKAGSATITAQTAGGYAMTCKVNVIKNVYKKGKAKVSQVRIGNSAFDFYNISYDKKGNLVIKARLLNNTGRKILALKKVKIKIKDNNGKVIGTYSAKSIKKVNLKSGKAKNYTFKIKKSKLKGKKANLPMISDIVSSGKYQYRR